MGNNASTNIVINLDRTNPFYFAGEMVSGTVQLNVSDGQLRADELNLKLIGETGYETTSSVSDGNGGTTTTTEYNHVPFYTATFVFARPQPGEKELNFSQGQYSWPFQIQLTDHLPPTLNQPQSYPHVRYYLQFLIDKAWYKPNTRENRYLMVFPRVNLLQQPQCLIATMFGNQNRKDITLKGSLNKLGYVPGEMIMATIEIDNPRQVLIKHIDLSMIESHVIEPCSLKHPVFQISLPQFMNRREGRITETFVVMIPAVPLAPSYQFQGGITRAAVVSINYMLKFEVKVEGMFTNFEVIVPITLGTEPNPPPVQQQGINSLIATYSSNLEKSMFRDDDLPPSYDSFVQKN